MSTLKDGQSVFLRCRPRFWFWFPLLFFPWGPFFFPTPPSCFSLIIAILPPKVRWERKREIDVVVSLQELNNLSPGGSSSYLFQGLFVAPTHIGSPLPGHSAASSSAAAARIPPHTQRNSPHHHPTDPTTTRFGGGFLSSFFFLLPEWARKWIGNWSWCCVPCRSWPR